MALKTTKLKILYNQLGKCSHHWDQGFCNSPLWNWCSKVRCQKIPNFKKYLCAMRENFQRSITHYTSNKVCQCWKLPFITFEYQPISLLHCWLSIEQPIRLWLSFVLESLVNSNISTLTCPISLTFLSHWFLMRSASPWESMKSAHHGSSTMPAGSHELEVTPSGSGGVVTSGGGVVTP